MALFRWHYHRNRLRRPSRRPQIHHALRINHSTTNRNSLRHILRLALTRRPRKPTNANRLNNRHLLGNPQLIIQPIPPIQTPRQTQQPNHPPPHPITPTPYSLQT